MKKSTKNGLRKKTKIYVRNIAMGTTTEEINELLDLNPTTFLKNSKTQVYFNSKSKFKGHAIVESFL